MSVKQTQFLGLAIISVCILVTGVEGKKCPSVCTGDVKGCKQNGGKVVGYCVNGLACCDLTGKTTGSCGDVKKGDQINFVSPSYPSFHKHDLLCTFSMTLWEDTVGIKLEFIEIFMDGLGYAGNGAGCDSDMFYIKGFKSWTPPPMCGNLTGYSTVIERTLGTIRMDQLKLVGLMSSDKYRWKIKITQIKPFSKKTKEHKITAPDGNTNSVLKSWTMEASAASSWSHPDKGHLVSKMWGENNYDSIEIFNFNTSGSSSSTNMNLKLSETAMKHSRRTRSLKKRFVEKLGKSSSEFEKLQHSRRSETDPTGYEGQLYENVDLSSLQKRAIIHTEPDSENIFQEGPGNSDSHNDQDDDIIGIEMPMIVNGQDTQIKEVPWQVSIRLKRARLPKSRKNISQDTSEDDDDAEVKSTVNETVNSVTTVLPLPNTTEDGNNLFNVTTAPADPDYNDIELNGNATESIGSAMNISETTNSPFSDDLNSTTTTESTPKVPARNCSADEGSHFCGGSIISDRHILTAAHCFYGSTKLRGMEELDTIKIILGDTDACTRDLPEPGDTPSGNLTEQEHEIETVVIHYAYDNIALINDVAVIKLKRAIDFSGYVKPVKMATFGESFEGKEALASGWGMTNLTVKGAELPYILQSSRRFLVRNASECNHETERLFGAPRGNVTKHPKYSHAFQSILCTDTKMHSNISSDGDTLKKERVRGEVLVGPGDSGGPLVSESDDGEMVLIGIVSYGIPPEEATDAGQYIDFFQSVGYFRNWIEMAML